MVPVGGHWSGACDAIAAPAACSGVSFSTGKAHMPFQQVSSWFGGAALGIAAAGAAAVLAQPQLTADRVGEQPVEKPAVVEDFSQGFRAVAAEVSPAVVSIEARTN